MKTCKVNSLEIYPIKGCQAVSVEAITVRQSGIVSDREMMMVKDGKNCTQSKHLAMATISVQILEDGRFKLSHPEVGTFIHTIKKEGTEIPIEFYFNKITTLDQGDEIAKWCCEVLKENGIRMVSLPKAWDRFIPLPEFSRVHEKPQAQFYDAAPLLVVNQASYDDFNKRANHPIPINRFRANVIISGDLVPYEEDKVDKLSTDKIELLNVTVCERCTVTTIDQQTGIRTSKEPLKTLSKYRKRENGYVSGVMFGSYMTVGCEGILRVGDKLSISMK